MKLNILSIAYTLIYTFTFREATKRAAEWGAFQLPTNTKGVILKAFTSGVFLVLLPLSFYSLSLKVIPQLITNESSLVRLFWITTLITLLGFFPYTTKHLWNLVAQCKVAKGREGWLLTSIKVDPDLPHRNYSWQVFGLLGTAQLWLLVDMLLSQQVSFNLKEEALRLLVMTYLSEMIVLHHRAKALKYFYPESRPKNLLAWRTIPSAFLSILLPIIFAIFCSPWILWIEEETNGWYIAVGFALSLLGLFFPVYCNNALLLIAEKYKWIDQTCLELKGPKWFWKLGPVSIVAFGLVMWVNWDIYDRNRKDIFELVQTPIKKLIEGNAPPDLQPSQSDPAVIK